jgi:anti-sigma regulatory factor (Ser/Thr protein kinase)
MALQETDPGSELYAEGANVDRVIGYMGAMAGEICSEEAVSADGEVNAARTAAEIDPRLIAFMLPGIPGSVPVARFHIRAALVFQGLGQLADDAAIIVSELVTNAVQHACREITTTIGVTLARTEDPGTLIIAVSDCSPHTPMMRIARPGSERGRGLQIVESLAVHWGWHREPRGKAVFAILAAEGA